MYCRENVISKKDKSTGITVRVEWVDLGEGVQGDYNSEDPDDISLLRFDVSYRKNSKNWEFPDDASYCTQMPVNATKKQKMDALKLMLDKYFVPVINFVTEGKSIKKIGERLSWINTESISTGEFA